MMTRGQVSYYTENQAEDAMSVVAGWIGRNQKVRVQYHAGSAVDADIKKGIIRIPRLACASGVTQNALMLLRHRVYHEAGHIDETTIEKPAGALGEILNALEDRRIEAVEADRYKGCEVAFRWGNEWYNKDIAGKVLEGKVNAPLWEALASMGFMSDGMQPAWEISAKAKAYVKAAYEEFAKVRLCKNTSDCLELAKKILALLKDANEQYKKENPPQPQQGKPQQGKPQEGQSGGDSQPQSGGQGDLDDEDESEKKSGKGKDKKDGEEGEDKDGEDDGESGGGKDGEDKDGEDKDGEDKDGDSKGGKSEDGSEDDDGEGKGDGEEGEDEESKGDGESKEGSKEDEEEFENDKDGKGSKGDDGADDGEDDTGADGDDDLGTDGKGEKKDGPDGDAPYQPDDSARGKNDEPRSAGGEEDKDGWKNTGLDDELDGVSREAAMNEAIKDYFKNMDPADASYMSRRDLDEHTVPQTEDRDKATFKTQREMVAVMVASMTRALEQALRSLSRCRRVGYLPQGRLDQRRLVAIAKGLSKDIFYKIRDGQHLDVAVEVIVDESGSMGNYMNVRLLAIIIGEALNSIGVPFEITGTTTKFGGGHWQMPPLDDMTRTNPILYQHYVQFGETWEAARHRLVHTGAHMHNIDGEAVEYCVFRLLQRPERRKVVFSLSDGQPCGGQDRDSALGHNIRRVCERARKQGVEVYGFGIQTKTPAVFYGEKNFVYLDDPTTMSQEFLSRMATVVTGGQVRV